MKTVSDYWQYLYDGNDRTFFAALAVKIDEMHSKIVQDNTSPAGKRKELVDKVLKECTAKVYVPPSIRNVYGDLTNKEIKHHPMPKSDEITEGEKIAANIQLGTEIFSNANYVQIVEDSHYYDDLNQLCWALRALINTGIKMPQDIEYILTGLRNSLGRGLNIANLKLKVSTMAEDGMITVQVPIGSFIVPPDASFKQLSWYKSMVDDVNYRRDKAEAKDPLKGQPVRDRGTVTVWSSEKGTQEITKEEAAKLFPPSECTLKQEEDLDKKIDNLVKVMEMYVGKMSGKYPGSWNYIENDNLKKAIKNLLT